MEGPRRLALAIILVIVAGQLTPGMSSSNPCATSFGQAFPGLIPMPHSLPSGTNVCKRTCYDQSECSYSTEETLSSYPFLLYRCQCLGSCPPKYVLFGDYMKMGCQNVTLDQTESNRCTCKTSEYSFKCTFDVIEDPADRPYYCACCSKNQPD